MAITFVGGLVHEVTLGERDDIAGHFDPNYAPYALKTYDYPDTGELNTATTYTPLLIDNPTYDTWINVQMVRVGNIGFAGYGGETWFVLRDEFGAGLITGVAEINNRGLYVRFSGDATNPGMYVTQYLPENVRVPMTFRLIQDGTNHTIEVYVDGILQNSVVMANTNQTRVGSWELRSVNAGNYFAMSEVIMTDGEPTLGGRLSTRQPTGLATTNTWEGTWESLADEDTGSGISTADSGSRITGLFTSYNGPASPVGIRAVVESIRYVDNNSGLTVRGFIRDSNVDYDAVDVTLKDSSRVLTVWDTNPITGVDWTTSDISNLEGGVRSIIDV